MALDRSDRAVLAAGRAIRARERKEAKKARPKSPKADRGRVRDNAFLAWVRRQPCAVGPIGCGGPTESAHVRLSAPGEPMTGMQRKPNDARCVPLCVAHHREGPDAQHAHGERQWWSARGIDPLQLAANYYARFLSGRSEATITGDAVSVEGEARNEGIPQ